MSCWANVGPSRIRRRLGSYHKLKGGVRPDGYVKYMLKDSDEKKHLVPGHRLVLLAHVGPCPDGMETRHLNGIRSDNALSNLRWGTHQENADDQRRHGTQSRGEGHGNAKLTERDVREIRRLRAGGEKLAGLGERFGVHNSMIHMIVNRQRWKHVA